MPSEENEDLIAGLDYTGQFDRIRSDQSPRGPTHDVGYTTYARVFVNELAWPYMKDEKLRFPVGSIIVREKLSAASAASPEQISVMIKRPYAFNPITNGWEFLVADGR